MTGAILPHPMMPKEIVLFILGSMKRRSSLSPAIVVSAWRAVFDADPCSREAEDKNAADGEQESGRTQVAHRLASALPRPCC